MDNQTLYRKACKAMKKWLIKKLLHWHGVECFRIAEKIMWLGQDNGEAQQHLNNAKDELYRAERAFHKMAEEL